MIKLNNISNNRYVSAHGDTVHENIGLNIDYSSVRTFTIHGERHRVIQTSEYGVQRNLKKIDYRYSSKLNDNYYLFNDFDNYLEEWWQ